MGVLFQPLFKNNTVLRIIFAPVIFSLLHLQVVSARLEFAQKHLCSKKDNYMRLWHSPSLKFARWQRGWKARKKAGRIFPCIQYVLSWLVLFLYSTKETAGYRHRSQGFLLWLICFIHSIGKILVITWSAVVTPYSADVCFLCGKNYVSLHKRYNSTPLF